MDLATVKASLAHDPRFDTLVEYLAEKLEGKAADAAPAEVVDSSAAKPESLIERAEDKIVAEAKVIEAESIHLVGGGAEDPAPPAAA